MTTKTTKTVAKTAEENAALSSDLGAVYAIEDAKLIAIFPGDRRREMSLRMSMQKMLSFAKRAQEFESMGQADTFTALESLADFVPEELVNDEDLDFAEVLELFTRWSEAIGARLGKALI